MTPKVSVIIPIYGVEKYIERCARSLFEQTLDDIEFIFVDDCTKDNSVLVLESVLKEYPNSIPQTTILHHEVNKGLPQARKTGIEVASGEYIAHCDSDDWVDTDMYRAMYEKAKEEDADMVVCDFCEHDGDRSLHIIKGLNSSCTLQLAIRDIFYHIYSWSLCNKLVRRTVYLNSIVFPQANMGEDMALVLQMLKYTSRISYIEKPYYYYFANPKSIVHSQSTEKILSNFHQVQENISIVEENCKELYEDDEEMMDCVRYLSKNILFGAIGDSQVFSLWMRTYPELNLRMLKEHFPVGIKLRNSLILLGIYPMIRKLYNWLHK